MRRLLRGLRRVILWAVAVPRPEGICRGSAGKHCLVLEMPIANLFDFLL
jgi:hypothetical protein